MLKCCKVTNNKREIGENLTTAHSSFVPTGKDAEREATPKDVDALQADPANVWDATRYCGQD